MPWHRGIPLKYATGWAGPSLRFFADSEKTAAASAAKFAVAVLAGEVGYIFVVTKNIKSVDNFFLARSLSFDLGFG